MRPRTLPHLWKPVSSLYSELGTVTIRNAPEQDPQDNSQLALMALGWILADGDRAQRFLDLTGLSPDGLRTAIAEEATHRAVFDFLAAHEPDLIGAARALDVDPGVLVRAQQELGR